MTKPLCNPIVNEICPYIVGCNNGDVRLQGGTGADEGRVEVCMNGVWGTVCDNSWNDSDATIVCQQLGFSRFRMQTALIADIILNIHTYL